VPAVSVLLPFRNAQRFLTAALDSIRSQDFTDFEVVAIDDGSDDGSAALVSAAAAADPRIRLAGSRGRGLPDALNTAAAIARGKYLARMDADDLARPTRLARQVALLDEYPDTVVAGGAVDLIDEGDRTVGEIWYAVSDAEARQVLSKGSTPFCHPAATIRRSAFERADGYRRECELAEDLDLWLRLAPLGGLVNLDEKVISYRLHPASSSYDRIHTQIRSLYRALIANDQRRDDEERTRALAIADPWPLVELWVPAGGAAEHLAELTSWYVELAVTAGYDAHVDQLIEAICQLAPTTERATVAWRLWQMATVTALTAGRDASAMRHLASGRKVLEAAGRTSEEDAGVRALERARHTRLDLEVTAEDPPSSRRGGYLDAIHWFEHATRAFVYGWIARPHETSETALRLHVDGPRPIQAAVERVLRLDVVRAMGSRFAVSAFKVDLRYGEPVPIAAATVRVSVRYDDGSTHALEDANLLVRRPGATRTAIPRYHQRP
jgi:GT2 family glycosyltransferase